MTGSGRRTRVRDGGFTVAELLIYFVLATIVLGAAYQLLIGQNRLYVRSWELQDVRSGLRAAANVLAFELRQASAFGDPYLVTSDSFAIRSLQGSGVVCAKHGSQPRIGIWGAEGEFYAGAGDSALVFAAADWGTADDAWVPAAIVSIWESPSVGGVSSCAWGGGGVADPDLVVEVSGTATPPDRADGEIAITALGPVVKSATVEFAASHPALTCPAFDSRAKIVIDADKWVYDGVMDGCTFDVSIPSGAAKLHIQIDIEADDYAQLSDDIFADYEWDFQGGGGGAVQDSVLDHVHVGAPFRAFRRVQYGIHEQDGRWWLGRKVGSATGYERLMGPLRPPSDSGLVLVFYDANGTSTTDPTRVEMIDIRLRGESFGKVRQVSGGTPEVEQDSLTIRVTLRG